MAPDLEPVQTIAVVPGRDTALATGHQQLLLGRVDALQIGQQQRLPAVVGRARSSRSAWDRGRRHPPPPPVRPARRRSRAAPRVRRRRPERSEDPATPAAMAFPTISSAREGRVGRKVPMQPRRAPPGPCRQTKTPARSQTARLRAARRRSSAPRVRTRRRAARANSHQTRRAQTASAAAAHSWPSPCSAQVDGADEVAHAEGSLVRQHPSGVAATAERAEQHQRASGTRTPPPRRSVRRGWPSAPARRRPRTRLGPRASNSRPSGV